MDMLERRIRELEAAVIQNQLSCPESPLRDATISFIQKVVAEKSGVGLRSIVGKWRRQREGITNIRFLAMVLCDEFTSATQENIAEHFTLSDHTNIRHAKKRWPKLTKKHPALEKLGIECRREIVRRLKPSNNKGPEWEI
jgi:chromosomal replication initiation ATPase DnaA